MFANLRTASHPNLSMALAIHELATNAVKYGLLSVEQGHLDVTWRVKDSGGQPVLELLWLETRGPPVSPPTGRGYGTKLIELSVVRGLAAKVNREFLETGMRCQILVPLTADIGRIRAAEAAGESSS